MDSKREVATLFAYGSLRKGMYNYEDMIKQYGKKSIKYIGTIKLAHFTMYSLGSYPVACPSPTLIDISATGEMKLAQDAGVTVDVLEVSLDVLAAINSMERGAGYYPTAIQAPKSYKQYKGAVKPCRGIMYIMDTPLPVVLSGDWVEHMDLQTRLRDSIKAAQETVNK